ncbi:hypothetical protein A6764_06345 [Brevibacillus sp. WF146]|uniref:hypothetical protein n=1 Tax=Brevibacillus sp. WF146 TaxID=319501 RepID=UPI0021002A8A|nr:hypothetical protein [Brevibacillus sp. WF146]UYZ14578.1 hypothetical protein A6764_06345 [Brevibacillus sp. WF146]
MLYDADGTAVERDGETLYWEQPMIYQKRVELPVVTVETANGPYEGRLLWGSFWIGGFMETIGMLLPAGRAFGWR